MTRSPITSAVPLSLLLLIGGSVIQACGEETPCEKAWNIQKRICRESNSENCFPCACIVKDWGYDMAFEPGGGLDVFRSSCISPDYLTPGKCEGFSLEYAQECINDESTCDPRYIPGGSLKMFDDGVAEPGFEGICDGDW